MNAELDQQILEASKALRDATAKVQAINSDIEELQRLLKEKEKERDEAKKQLQAAELYLRQTAVGEAAGGPSHSFRLRR